MKDGKYIAYFQAYTGTYAPVSKLRALFTEAIMHPDVVAISIATRPDCLPPETLDLLAELNEISGQPVRTVNKKDSENVSNGISILKN
jgi:radical SAM superfamily enzyme